MRQTFEAHLKSVWTTSQANDIIKKIDWVLWLEGTGLPPITANFTTVEEKTALKLADDYISLKGASSPTGFEAYKTWPVVQKKIFLGQLLNRKADLTVAIVKRVGDDLTPM